MKTPSFVVLALLVAAAAHGQPAAAELTRGIREFVARDRAAVRESKDACWGARIARLGPLEAFALAKRSASRRG